MDDQSTQDQGIGDAQVGQSEPTAMHGIPLPAPAAGVEPPAGMPPASAAVATPPEPLAPGEFPPELEAQVDAQYGPPAHMLPPLHGDPAGAPPTQAPAGLPPTVPVQSGQTTAPAQGTAGDDGQDASAAVAEIPVPAEAADQDVIEREWIDKIKHVIEKTAHDPYQQVHALNQLRAEYMKKRYNKDIVVPEQ